MRPSASKAPEVVGSFKGTPNHIDATGAVYVDLDSDEVDDVRISTRAVDSFRFHHGGSARSARAQLAAMLEDFLIRSARSTGRNGFVTLSREGYTLVLAPDLATVTAYRTVHRERTWEQVKSGVSSRFGHPGSQTRRPRTGSAPEPGPALAPDVVLRTVDPATIYLTGRVRSAYDRLTGSSELDDAELDARIRAGAASIKTGLLNEDRRAHGIEVFAEGFWWLVSDDAATLIGVKRNRSVPSETDATS